MARTMGRSTVTVRRSARLAKLASLMRQMTRGSRATTNNAGHVSATAGGGRVGGRGGGYCEAGPCGACKVLHRKCARDCIFAPYFDPEEGAKNFAAVQQVFGARNASRLLRRVPPHFRAETARTLCYQAKARIQDPIYGRVCVGELLELRRVAASLMDLDHRGKSPDHLAIPASAATRLQLRMLNGSSASISASLELDRSLDDQVATIKISV